MNDKNYTDEDFINVVKNSISVRQVLIQLGLNPAGGNYKTVKFYIERLKLDISHFLGQGHLKGKKHNWKKETSLNEILIENSVYKGGSYKIKKRLLRDNLLEKKCYNCGLTKWLDKDIPLELEHINGNNRDHRKENLTLLCPNCHSLTSTYRGKAKKINRIKYKPIKIKEKYFCQNCNIEVKTKSKTGLCLRCAPRRLRRSNRPSKEILLEQISKLGYCGTGRTYGVSDNAIRKWLKQM